MPSPRICEIVLQLSARGGGQAGESGTAADALLRLPGVIEAHVDEHGRWAMVCYQPTVTSIAAISGCLTAHGLMPTRARPLVTDSDECE